MAGGTYTLYIVTDASGAVTGLRAVKGAIGETAAAAKEAESVFAGMFKFFAIAEIVSHLYKAVDAFLSVESSIRVAGVSAENTYDTFNKLLNIADQTRAPIEKLAELYRNLGLYAKQLKLDQDDLLAITKSVGEAIALTGGTSQRAQNGVIQLAKALEEGKIQGQTFNALIKDFPALLNATALAAGKSTIELKNMASTGALTSRGFADLLIKAGPILDKQFERSIITLSQAFTVLENNVIGAVADIDHATGAFSSFASVIVAIAQNFRVIAPFLVNFGIAMVAVRLAMAAYTAQTTLASAATLLFGKSMVDAEKGVVVMRLALASVFTLFILAATAILQFGDKVKVSIGPVTNLREAFVAFTAVVNIFVTRVLGVGPSLVLLSGVLLSFRLSLGLTGIALTAVAALLLRFQSSTAQWVIVMTSAVLVLGAFQRALGLTTIAVTLFNGVLATISIVVGGFATIINILNGSLTILDVLLATTWAEFAGVAIAIGLVVAAVALLITYVPGVQTLLTIFTDLIALPFVTLYNILVSIGDAINNIIKLVTGFDLIKWAKDWIAAGWEKIVDWLKSIWEWLGKIAERLGQSVKNALDFDKAMQQGQTEADKLAVKVNNVGNAAETAAEKAKRLASALAAAGAAGPNTPNAFGPGAGGFAPSSSGGSFASQPIGGETDANRLQNIGVSQSGSAQDTRFPNTVGTSSGGTVGWAGGSFADLGRWGGSNLSEDFATTVSNGQKLLEDQQKATQTAAKQAQIAQNQLDAQQAAAQKAQEQAAAQQAALQRIAAIEQATNQSLEQGYLNALNAFGVSSVSQLPGNVQGIIQQTAQLQGQLADSNFTDPVARAEVGRQIQILTDALNALTNTVKDATDDNPYTKYAQNVYGDLVGIQSSVAAGASAGVTNALVLASSGSSASSISSGGGSGGGSSGGGSSHSSSSGSSFGSGITGSHNNNGGLPFYLGAFADGGDIGIGSDGMYAAYLHAGERVTIDPNPSGGAKQININMNVNGVQDVDGFRRSRRQIMATLYRDLMAIGEQT